MIPPTSPLLLVRDAFIRPTGVREGGKAPWSIPALRPTEPDDYLTYDSLPPADAFLWAENLLASAYSGAFDVHHWVEVKDSDGDVVAYCPAGHFTTCVLYVQTFNGAWHEIPFTGPTAAREYLAEVRSGAIAVLEIPAEPAEDPLDDDRQDAPRLFLPVAALARLELDSNVVPLLLPTAPGVQRQHEIVTMGGTPGTRRAAHALCTCGGYSSMWHPTVEAALREATRHTAAV